MGDPAVMASMARVKTEAKLEKQVAVLVPQDDAELLGSPVRQVRPMGLAAVVRAALAALAPAQA